jgi:hypothetical protein
MRLTVLHGSGEPNDTFAQNPSLRKLLRLEIKTRFGELSRDSACVDARRAGDAAAIHGGPNPPGGEVGPEPCVASCIEGAGTLIRQPLQRGRAYLSAGEGGERVVMPSLCSIDDTGKLARRGRSA